MRHELREGDFARVNNSCSFAELRGLLVQVMARRDLTFASLLTVRTLDGAITRAVAHSSLDLVEDE